MKTLLYMEIEGFKDGSIAYEIAKGMRPSVGHFGPQHRIIAGTAPDLDSALRVIVLECQTNPEVQLWAKAQTE